MGIGTQAIIGGFIAMTVGTFQIPENPTPLLIGLGIFGLGAMMFLIVAVRSKHTPHP